MALDVESFTDALLLGTKALIAKELAPLLADNASLKAQNAALASRLAAVEAREMPEFEAPDLSGFATRAYVDAVRAAVEAVEPPSLPDVPALVAEAVRAAVGALPKAQDGRDADPAEIDALRAEIADVRRSIPEPVDLTGLATKAEVDALPKPVEPDMSGFATKAEVAEAIASIPTPPDAPDLTGMATKADVDAVRAAIPTIPEQKDFGPEIAALADRIGAIRIPDAIPGKDGLGIAEVKQNADGELIVKMTNGETVNAGKVRGADGMGFDDLSIEFDGERTITLVLTRGERAIRKEIVLPIVLDRGIWKDGATYVRGDSISYGGSTWIVQVDETQSRPGTDKTWRLSNKAGRDGKSLYEIARAAGFSGSEKDWIKAATSVKIEKEPVKR